MLIEEIEDQEIIDELELRDYIVLDKREYEEFLNKKRKLDNEINNKIYNLYDSYNINRDMFEKELKSFFCDTLN